MSRKYYLEFRNKYVPLNLKIIFVLESPPISGKYFYDPKGSVHEPLFKAMMNLLRIDPISKEEGLKTFRNTGHFLVDATYNQVNTLKGKTRNNLILAGYPSLREDLSVLCKDSNPDIILIKANICRLLERKLKSDGFKIKNNGLIIPFPSTGHQNEFIREMRKLCF